MPILQFDRFLTRQGFTIVELLIVIVVIAVLAAISVVAYNGIQDRAENTKTITAATAYVKAIKMYEAKQGEVPHMGYDSCIGDAYPWDYAGSASGMNQCRSSNSSYYVIKGSINATIRDQLGESLPSPSMQTIGNETSWARGIYYLTPAVGGQLSLAVALRGVTDCPSIAGTTASGSGAYSNGRLCVYNVGTRVR